MFLSCSMDTEGPVTGPRAPGAQPGALSRIMLRLFTFIHYGLG